MTESRSAGPSRWNRWGRVAVPVGLAVLIGGSIWFGVASMSGVTSDPPDDWATKMIEVPPLVAAKPVPAATAGLSPSESVIGVSIGGKHRAYPISAMSRSASHVVNDRVGDHPLTVVYCDRTKCVRGFTAKGQQSPLDLAVGGWLNEGGVQDMLLRHGKHRYQLKSEQAVDPAAPPFPFQSVQAELTTWGKWREAHPDAELVQEWRPAYTAAR